MGAVLGLGCGRGRPSDGAIRIGHFPNLTHAQALVARHRQRTGDGWLPARIGVPVEWVSFNAGPSAMEALLAGSIDATYVGPNPAINTHFRSKGDEVRVVAGAAFGGSSLLVRKGAGIRSAADLRGRKVATPQLGNTQDVVCRAWLRDAGLDVRLHGGEVTVLPMPNPEQLSLMASGAVDAVWTVEPWVSRIERDTGAEILVDDAEALTTVLVVGRRLLAARRDLVRRLVEAHAELTTWLVAHPVEAQAAVRAEILALTRQDVPAELVAHAWPRIRFASPIDRAPFDRFVEAARRVGFLTEAIPLDRLVEVP